MHASQSSPSAPREGFVPAEHARLYYREIGRGQPVIVLHGGPDFDHTYLLPDLDRLADRFRLIYYDQRGRGRSAENVQPEEVTMESEIEDLDRLRKYFRLDSVALLGHSWGGLLAMEYALRHPERLPHLVLMNTAPASTEDYRLLQQDRRRRAPADMEKLKGRASDSAYQAGDPDTVAAYYQIHFRTALRQTEQLEKIIERLKASFTREGVLKARAIEEYLMQETWYKSEYNLLPQLTGLNTRTLILHGEHDLVPVECADHIAQAIPGSRFVQLRDCGHFSYLECPEKVYYEIAGFFL